MGDQVMRHVLFLSAAAAAAAAFLVVSASPSLAAKSRVWVGRDLDNSKIVWTCTNVSGDDWKLKKNGETVGEYEGVTSTDDFVELQLKGSKEFDRVRLYKDKLAMNKEGSKTQWIQIAKGKWSD